MKTDSEIKTTTYAVERMLYAAIAFRYQLVSFSHAVHCGKVTVVSCSSASSLPEDDLPLLIVIGQMFEKGCGFQMATGSLFNVKSHRAGQAPVYCPSKVRRRSNRVSLLPKASGQSTRYPGHAPS